MYGSYGVGLGGATYPYPAHGPGHGHAHAHAHAHTHQLPHAPAHVAGYASSSTWSAAGAPPASSLPASVASGGALGLSSGSGAGALGSLGSLGPLGAAAAAPAPALPDVSASHGAAQAVLARRHVSLPDAGWWRKKASIANAHKEAVRSVAWSGDGAWLATCGDESVKLWAPSRSTDARSARVLGAAVAGGSAHGHKVSQLVWDPAHPRVLASAGSDKTVRLWDVRAGEAPTASVPVPSTVLNMVFHPAGTSLAISDHDDRVSLLDPRFLARGVAALVRDRKASKDEEVNEIAWTRDGRQFVLAKNKGAMEVLAAAPVPALAMQADAELGAETQSAEERRDSKEGGVGAPLLPWTRTHLVRGHTSNLFALACDPTNRYAVSGGADSVLALWRTSDWTRVGSYDGLTEMVRAVSFSCDGELIASLGEPGMLVLVASATMGAVAHIPFPSTTGSLSWHPSRYTLAYASGKTPALVNVAGQI